MPRGRYNNIMLDAEIENELQNDEDSEVESDDDIDGEMQGVIEEYCDLIQEMEESNVDEPEDIRMDPGDQELVLPAPSVRRSRGRSRGRSRSRRGALRSRGHTRCTPRSSTAGQSYRLSDEANGWSFEVKQTLSEDPVFEEDVGVKIPLDVNWTPLDCFELFFTSEFWKSIKHETNRYAAQQKAKLARRGELKPHSTLSHWTPVTENELKKFFSIIVHMTLVKKESLDSYWYVDTFLNTPFPGKMMSRQRFRAIYSCLHLNDNSNFIPRGEQNYDAFFKLRPFFDRLVEQSKNLYEPKESLTIDEGTCGFRRRVHFRVYNKEKPDKYGMKIYMLCEAESGYVLQMVPHVGDSKSVDKIIMELMEGYLDKWHSVYMDRFFSNPTIMDILWLRKTRAVGTVMPNRKGLPQEWRYQELECNEMSFCHRGNLTVCKWRDKRDVHILTTKHVATWTEVTVKAKGGHAQRVKPDCILDYNRNKISVDLCDQYVAYYALKRKSMKWWKKMFFHLFARATVNAYIIHYKTKTPGQKRLQFSQFLRECGSSLAEKAGLDGSGEASGSRPHFVDATRLTGRHFLEPIPPTASKATTFRVCKVCADIGKARTGTRGRKETRYQCEICKIPLCAHPCFKMYHTKRDYTR